jgi:hypothetical protein
MKNIILLVSLLITIQSILVKATLDLQPASMYKHVSYHNVTHSRIMKRSVLNFSQSCPPDALCQDEGFCCPLDLRPTSCCGSGELGTCCNTTYSICTDPTAQEPFYACCRTGYPIRCPQGRSCCSEDHPICCNDIPTHAGCCPRDSICIEPNGCCPNTHKNPCFKDGELHRCCNEDEVCCKDGTCSDTGCGAIVATGAAIGAIVGGVIGGVVGLVLLCCIVGVLGYYCCGREKRKDVYNDQQTTTTTTVTHIPSNVPQAPIISEHLVEMTEYKPQVVIPASSPAMHENWRESWRSGDTMVNLNNDVRVVMNQPITLLFSFSGGALQEMYIVANPLESMSDVIHNYCERAGLKPNHHSFCFYDSYGVKRSLDQRKTVRDNGLFDHCTIIVDTI